MPEAERKFSRARHYSVDSGALTKGFPAPECPRGAEGTDVWSVRRRRFCLRCADVDTCERELLQRPLIDGDAQARPGRDINRAVAIQNEALRP